MVKDRVGSLGWLRKRIEDADTDLLREMVKVRCAPKAEPPGRLTDLRV